MKLLFIGFGGFFGAISRYLVSKSATKWFGNLLPYGTLIVNVVGSFILAFIYTASIEKLDLSENFRFFLGVGFLGAFTTFSTFSVETLHFYEDGAYLMAGLNVVLNVLLSLAGAFIGITLAKL
jgi:CrcB protein